MIATVVLAAVAALDLSGVFPPEVKTMSATSMAWATAAWILS